MKAILVLVSVVLLCAFVAGCAPGPNELAGAARDGAAPAGFWLGLWHGIISPVVFVISLFSKTAQMYEVHNNGAWYNLGFLFGMSIIFGGGAGGAAHRAWRRR